MSIQVLSAENFKEFIESSTLPVIVDFYADWCGPCKMIAPVLEALAEEKKDEINVCKLNVDSNQQLAAEFEVRSIPCIISFKNGEVYKRVVGAVPKAELLALVE